MGAPATRHVRVDLCIAMKAPLYDRHEGRHHCPFCRFLIWFSREGAYRYFGDCECRRWCLDTWDDHRAYWSCQPLA